MPGDFKTQIRIAGELAGGRVQHLVHEDTFFNVPFGRLKLRVFVGGGAELIQYEREDARGPKQSRYISVPITDPEPLKQALARAVGVRAVVRKRRNLYLVGQTRIHLDQVEGLGEFLELEVVLKPGDALETGVAIAEDLMLKLQIQNDDLIDGAYVDLLANR